MKFKLLAVVLLAGFISMNSNAGFEQFTGPVGEMNVFWSPGDWDFWSEWGIADLQSITTDNRTFELLPNVNAYADNPGSTYWRNNDGAGPDGNRWMEASTVFKLDPVTAGMTSATFSFTVDEFTLSNRYSVVGFIKVLDPANDYQPERIDQVAITTTGSHTLSVDTTGTAGMVLLAGWMMSGLNANPADDWGSVTVTATALDVDTGDITAPTPDPMTFASAPVATSDQAISMTATTATDDTAVEYFFTCTTDNAFDSGWQSDTNYAASGLDASTLYTFTVKARDTSLLFNETAPSASASATTFAVDTTPPSPNPMTFAVAPVAASTLISMTATTASDTSGVEYFFTCTTDNAFDSEWQSSPSYMATGLEPASNYTFTVTARDLSAATNVTAASTPPASATTAELEPWMVNSFMGYTGDTWQDSTVFDLNVDGLEVGSISDDSVSAISFDGSGATFSDEAAGYWGRNVLRTLGQDYDESSFEAYATIVFDGAVDQTAFIGLGQGIVAPDVSGNWGVPDLALGGVNSVVTEIKTDLAAGTNLCNVMKIQDGFIQTNTYSPAVATIDTFRIKLAYDADAETATVSLDTGYAGGAFVEDRVLGTIDTSGLGGTNMWFGAPVRVFVGGGEGTVVSDLVIKATDHVVGDLSIAGPIAGGGMVFSWDGSAGQTYDVQYKTDLVYAPTWTTDPSSGCSDIFVTASGTMSATSTVSGIEVFYQVIAK